MPNLSQIKRQRMLEFLNKIREEHSDDASLIAVNEIETELTNKKYGLIWEAHEERVDDEMRTQIPVFSEVKDKEIISDKSLPYNFLLEGDNLHSLKLLEKTHKERINVIYIDPPYNTGGQDFSYDDTFVDENDGYRHSKWLSFMSERLQIMQKLLADTGVIFISIGEQEVANLRLLCDEIFGEPNYITIFSRQMKSGGAKGKYYTPNIDYILTYAKNVDKLPYFRAIMTQKQIDTFYNKVEMEGPRKGEVYGEERLFKASLDIRPNQRYYIQCPDGSFAIPPGVNFPENLVEGEIVRPTEEDKVWKWIYPSYKKEYDKGNIVFKKTTTSGLVDENGNQSQWNIYNKLWLNEQQDKGVVPSNFITAFENRQSAAEMKAFNLDFTYAKPVNLIKYLLTISQQPKDSIILDCFAGSGTTGQAVLALNQEDDGKRRFILCTNNEGGICENITYKRLFTTIKELDESRTENTILYEEKFNQKLLKNADKVLEEIENIRIESQKYYDKTKVEYKNDKVTVYGIKINEIQNGIPANLKYYKTKFVKKSSDSLDYCVGDNLLNYITELVQLEYAVKLDGTNYILLLSDEEADSVIADGDKLKECKGLFISSSVLLTGKQQKKLADMDIKVFTIPDYYFESELLEVGER